MRLKEIAFAYSPSCLRPLFIRIEKSSIGRRLASGLLWSIIGTMSSRGMMLIASIVVARVLGKTIYGELGIIRSTVGMFGAFAGFGLGLTATKHVAEFRRKNPERAGQIIALSELSAIVTGGVMAIILFFFAPWLAQNTLNAAHLGGVLRIAALLLFIEALNGAQTGALAGFAAFKSIASVNLYVGLLSFPIIAGGAWIGKLSGVVWALVINLAVNWLLNHIALRKEAFLHHVPFTMKNVTCEWSILWKFSIPAVFGGVVVSPVNWACNALLVNQANGYGEMGVFNAANQWFVMLLFLPGMFGKVLLPMFSEQMGKNNVDQSMKTLVLAIKANICIVIPLVVLTSFFSPFIMKLYGEGFSEGWLTLIVVLLTAGLVSAQGPVGQIITASGRMWTGFMMNCGWALVFLSTAIAFNHRGALGLASARLVSYAFHAIWTFGFAIWLLRGRKRN